MKGNNSITESIPLLFLYFIPDNLEYQETEDSKQYQCRHYDAGDLVYESEEPREAYDGNRSPYG